jgi:hypothetical protein
MNNHNTNNVQADQNVDPTIGNNRELIDSISIRIDAMPKTLTEIKFYLKLYEMQQHLIRDGYKILDDVTQQLWAITLSPVPATKDLNMMEKMKGTPADIKTQENAPVKQQNFVT